MGTSIGSTVTLWGAEPSSCAAANDGYADFLREQDEKMSFGPDIDLGGTYVSEQEGEDIERRSIRRKFEEVQQARRHAHNVAQLECTRHGRIQKPAGRKSTALKQVKKWLGR